MKNFTTDKKLHKKSISKYSTPYFEMKFKAKEDFCSDRILLIHRIYERMVHVKDNNLPIIFQLNFLKYYWEIAALILNYVGTALNKKYSPAV